MKYCIQYLLLFLPVCLFAQERSTDNFGVIVEINEKDMIGLLHRLEHESVLNNIKYRWITQDNSVALIESGDDKNLFKWCLQQPEILSSSYNGILTPRIRPNDKRLAEQYYLNHIKAFDTWNYITGGTTFGGEDIVIGVIDNGFDIQHEDLKENIFTNSKEIPDNKKDDDGNGYIDDYNGWNQNKKNGNHDLRSHGTNILGVLGAKGNNSTGIAGVNWNVKLLPVTTGDRISDIIEALDYFISMKKLYRQTNGSKGANIVVTSYSGGAPYLFAEDYPAWCGMYDKLGKEGILSVGATTNEPDNVEEVGDLPSTCTSPYLIIVNASNKNDEMEASTGHGYKSVDISAPGDHILTTDLQSNNYYSTSTGTSLATPMVAGAAALLYALPCQTFSDLIKEKPQEAPLVIRDAILNGVDKKASMTGKTVTEGRLNILNTLNILTGKYCDETLTPVGTITIKDIKKEGSQLSVRYQAPENATLSFHLYDMLGKEVLNIETNTSQTRDNLIHLPFNTSQYVHGVYILSVVSGKNVISKQFMLY